MVALLWVLFVLALLASEVTQAGGSCTGTINLTNCSGNFSDGSGQNNYENLINCQWLIQPAGAYAVTLSFTSFDVEDGYDEVCVYDGATTSDPLISCFTGNTIPSSISSSGGSMLVVFTSDEVETRAGWSASYSCQIGPYCNASNMLTSCDDGLSDGSGAGNYLNNTNCRWLIQPPGATSISLSFSSFDTEEIYDEVCIYDGDTNIAPLLGCFSGNSIPPTVTSSTGSMLVVFSSDNTETRSGWTATYACQTGSNCNGLTTLTACTSSFHDGSGSGNYANNANCEWLIQPTGATTITLNFTSFDTELDYDEVCVYDGSTDAAPLINCFSGNTIPPAINSSAGSLFVVFTSDNSLAAAGWSASYSCQTGQYCNGNTILTDCSGSLHDGSGPGSYLNNTDCQWLIQPSGADSITLTFTSFSTEEFFDEVCIYDGNSDLAPLLGCYSGNAIPAPITSTGGSMLITFINDSSVTDQGWSASYSSCQSGYLITGVVKTELNTFIPNTVVTLSGTTNAKDTTATDGVFSFNVAPNDDITITPSKSGDILSSNGVTTLDIVLIQRQILAVQYLNSPYKIIAADVNASSSVTTLDIVLIRSVILQTASTFPNGRLWRFVPSDFIFQNPLNPFPFDNFRSYTAINENKLNQHFTGIKLGDVNNSWDPNVAKTAAIGEVKFLIDEYSANMDDEIFIPVRAKGFKKITGYQFTISWNPEVIQLLTVMNQSLRGYFGLQKVSQGYLTTSWSDDLTRDVSLNEDEVVFQLKFKVIGKEGAWSQINIGSELTRGEAYNENFDLLRIESENGIVRVRESHLPVTSHPAKNISIEPNPFSNTTSIVFSIAQEEPVNIVIHDLHGSEVRRITGYFNAGTHRVEWIGDGDNGESLGSGLYHVQVIAGNNSFFTKAIIIR